MATFGHLVTFVRHKSRGQVTQGLPLQLTWCVAGQEELVCGLLAQEVLLGGAELQAQIYGQQPVRAREVLLLSWTSELSAS